MRYLGAVSKALRNPFNPGDEIIWFLVWIGFVAIVLVALGVFGSRAFKIVLALIGLTAMIMVVLSGSPVPFGISLWLIAVSILVGDITLVLLGLNDANNVCDRLVIAFPIGLTALGLLAFILALLGLYTPAAAWAVLVGLTVLGWKRGLYWYGHFRAGRRFGSVDSLLQKIPEAAFLILAAGFVFLLNFAWSIAPEVHYDTLNMRLSVPKIYLQEGRFVDLPYMFHSYFVRLIEFVYGFGMALHDEAVAKFLNAAISVAAALAVFSLGRLLFSPVVGLWAAVFFYTTPLASWVAGTAYIDLAVALFGAALVWVCLTWHRTRRHEWLVVAGVLAGAAVSIKLTAATVVASVAVVLVVSIIRSRQPIRWKVRAAAGFVITSVLVALPWHLSFVLTGSPIFPMMNAVFRSPKWALVNSDFTMNQFGLGTSLSAFAVLPFWLSLDTGRFGEVLIRGAVGPLMLLFVPLGILLIIKKDAESRVAGSIAILSFVLWAFAFQYGRFYLAVLPLIAVFAVAGTLWALPDLFRGQASRLVLGLLMVAQVVVLPLQFLNIPQRFPIRFAFGRESREDFLHRALSGYGAAQHLNAVVPKGHKVLAIGFEDLRLYLNPQLETLAETLFDSPLRRVIELRGAALAEALVQRGYTHLLVAPKDLKSPPSYHPYAFQDFLAEFATLEYSRNDALVYRLKG